MERKKVGSPFLVDVDTTELLGRKLPDECRVLGLDPGRNRPPDCPDCSRPMVPYASGYRCNNEECKYASL